jgi:hypothetical protein
MFALAALVNAATDHSIASSDTNRDRRASSE